MKQLTIIIVSYNTREMTLACLDSLFQKTSLNKIDVVVFDNASQDGSADAISERFNGKIQLIRSEKNIGFAAANNTVAQDARTPYLLLLNPDTVILDDGIEKLLQFALQKPEHGIYGGRTLFGDKSLNIASCWSQMSVWSLFCHAIGLTSFFPRSNWFDHEAMGNWKRDTVREVDIVVGCLLLIRRDLWMQLGGFNLKYFMYGEEADLCLRARRLGFKPVVTPDCTIVHYVGASSTKSEKKICMVAKAKSTLLKDHWPNKSCRIGLSLLWLWAASRRIFTELGSVFFRSKLVKSRAKWKYIWENRRDWLGGY